MTQIQSTNQSARCPLSKAPLNDNLWKQSSRIIHNPLFFTSKTCHEPSSWLYVTSLNSNRFFKMSSHMRLAWQNLWRNNQFANVCFLVLTHSLSSGVSCSSCSPINCSCLIQVLNPLLTSSHLPYHQSASCKKASRIWPHTISKAAKKQEYTHKTTAQLWPAHIPQSAMDKTPNTERHQTPIRVEQKLGAHAGILQQRKDIRVEQKLGVHAGLPAAKERHNGWA